MQDIDVKKFLSEPSRVEWACRRGMLELDVIFGKFFKDAYPTLSEGDKISFIHLLSCNDPQLFSWLLGHEVAEDKEHARMVAMIREHVRARI